MNNLNLHGLKMNVVETASNGVVNAETIFHFQQKGNVVSAKYYGGGVRRGFLAGRIHNNTLRFKYAQQHEDANIHGGISDCEISKGIKGRIELIENFEWGGGAGRNVFRTLEHYLTLDEIGRLVEQFENQTLPKEKWNHNAHLVVGMWYCQNYEFREAIYRMRECVIAYNDANGTVNSDYEGYHETITRFWLQVISDFLSKNHEQEDPFNLFLNSQYANKEYIFKFYSRKKLFSKKARRLWVFPNSLPKKV